MPDAYFDDLLSELRTLRRLPSGSLEDRLAMRPQAVTLIGDGDITLAASRLNQVRQRYADDPESDIAAYFYTLDRPDTAKSSVTTLDQRLTQYADTWHIEKRTALRRSDRGATKIGKLLRDQWVWDRPWIRLWLIQPDTTDPNNPPDIRCYLDASWPIGTIHSAMQILINDQPTPTVEFDMIPYEADHPLSGREHTPHPINLPDLPLDWNTDNGDTMAQIDLSFVTEIWPQWGLTIHTTDPRLAANLETQTGNHATTEIIRWEPNN